MNIAEELKRGVGNGAPQEVREAEELMDRAADELERCWETINQAEDLMGCALAHLDGEPGYANGQVVIDDLRAYFDARRAGRGALVPNGQSE